MHLIFLATAIGRGNDCTQNQTRLDPNFLIFNDVFYVKLRFSLVSPLQ